MTDSFSALRFARLWRAHWSENWRYYAWFFGVTAMIDLLFVAIFLGTKTDSRHQIFQFDGQVAWYFSGLFVSGIIFSGRHFRELANPGSALVVLMRPASVLEKWLLAFVCISVLFPLAYTLGYCLLNYPVVQMAKALYAIPEACMRCDKYDPDFSFYVPLLTSGVDAFAAKPVRSLLRQDMYFLLLLWSVQALVLGSTVFYKRSPILRTALQCFVLVVVLGWLGTAPHLGAFNAWSPGDREALDWGEYALSLMLWIGLPVLLWIAAYFHLKEREVS